MTTRKTTSSKKKTATTIKPIRLFSSDIDGTLMPFDSTKGVSDFVTWWNAIPKTKRPLLCYNSGRLSTDVLTLIPKSGLQPPDYIIGGVGTSLLDAKGNPVEGFHDRFRDNWDRSLVHEVLSPIQDLIPQPACFQSPYKSSWYLQNAPAERISEIMEMLKSVELNACVIYSSDRDLDVLPAEAGKGKALEWLCEHVGISNREVAVAGDSENDLAMFSLTGVRGIVVGNARSGLINSVTTFNTYRAQQCDVAGVIEGLQHYGLSLERSII